MKEFNTPPLPQFQNPWQEITQLQKEMVEAMGEMAADITAQRGLLSALISTHPCPDQLLEDYLLYMDSIADSRSPERIEKYRQAMQPWKDALLNCVNERKQS